MYQVLARKYRPKNFHELLGQTHVSTALINGIEHQRLHHAYLFTGTRGVGKTTIARILAKCLNCETGITSEPCGVCATCVAIDAGRFIDLIEIDAASRTKVEDTRELLDNVPYAPTQGRYKVYLIDEVHMLSTHSFNALLKTLEEPPEHVKFLLATTDPQKLPITIISRCLQFVLRPIPQSQLAEYLGTILQKENITYQSDALWQLASSARGSVRDALSLTDQAIAFGNGQIEPTTVKNMLGLIDQADVIGLLLAIVQQQKSQIAGYIQQLREQVVDAKAVFDSFAEILHQVALLQILPDFDLQLSGEQTHARQNLAHTIPSDLLQLYYEIVVQSRENMGLANTPLQALEMCILRLLAFRPLSANQVAATPIQLPNSEKTFDSQTLVSQTLPVQNLHTEDTDLQYQSFEDLTLVDSKNIHGESKDLQNQKDSNSLTKQLAETNQINSRVQNTLLQAIPSTVQNFENPIISQQVLIENEQRFSDNPPASLIESQNFIVEHLPDNQAPSTDSLVTQNQALQNNGLFPLDLLEPETQELTGQWTPQKWDYWVYQARINDWLKGDELSLAKQGVMMGNMVGKSYFLINKDSTKQQEKAFYDLCTNLTHHFPEMQVALQHFQNTTNEIIQTVNLSTDTPDSQQSLRRQKAIECAEQKITQEPVIQALLEEHATVQNVVLLK